MFPGVTVSVGVLLGIQINLGSTNLRIIIRNNKRIEKEDIRDIVNKGYFRHIADMFGVFPTLVSVIKSTKIGFQYSFNYTTKLG